MKTQLPLARLAVIGVALFMAAQTASAITTSGVMTNNETWSGTVTLTGDVTVPANVTLTILPGTRVECWDKYDDQVGGVNSSRIELIVAGRLTAQGAKANPILFTSSPSTPPALIGDWYGIRIVSTTGTNSSVNTFQSCQIEYAMTGLTVEANRTTNLEDCDVRNNSVVGVEARFPVELSRTRCHHNPIGLNVLGSSARISGCMFDYNTSHGVQGDSASSLISSNCQCIRNSGSGIRGFNVTAITDSDCSNNGEYGVYGWWAWSDHPQGTVSATNSTFRNNAGSGIMCSGIEAVNCRVETNGSNGLCCYAGGAIIVQCSLVANQGWGFYAKPQSNWGYRYYVRAISCTIMNNTSGGIFGGYIDAWNCQILNNAGGAVDSGGIPEYQQPLNTLRIRQCNLSGNNGPGIACQALVPGSIESNRIIGNSVGVVANVQGSSASGISANVISGSSQYELKNEGTAAVIATNNFWGEPTTTELANNVRNLTKIYDSQDNAGVGQVILKPYLASDPPAVPPNITSQPSDLTVAAGATATFTVTATSATPMTYQWRKGTTNLQGQTNSFLTFTAQLSDSATNYNVVVSNSDGSTNSRWATLTVLVPPSITSQPTNLFLPAGSTAAFHVTATGSAPLSYRWYSGTTPLVNGGRVSGATSPDLTITSITPADAGSYWVQVTNSVRSTNSVAATLSLPTPPVITNQPKTQVVGLGGQAVFTVQATGTLPMTYQWYQNGAAIGGATGASLTVSNASPMNLGAYTVAITNMAGGIASVPASLWLNALKMYAGVNVYGPVGSVCAVDYTTNLTEPFIWLPLQSVTIVTNPTVIIDYDSPEQPNRFYRTVPIP